MTDALAAPQPALSAATLESVVIGGDLSKLAPAQRLEYYRARCAAAGLDPAATPFQYIVLNGRLTLYATKACTDQLSRVHGIKLSIISQVSEAGLRVVTVRAETKDGRCTEEIGAVPVEGLKADNLANAMMKAVTKAKRRAVLSMCGLGMLDETETETIRDARTINVDSHTGEIVDPSDRPSLSPVERSEIDAFATGSPPQRTRVIQGIPIKTTKDWEQVQTLPLGGKNPYCAMTLGAIIHQDLEDDREALDFLEGTAVRAVLDKWNKTTPAKKADGVGLASECLLIAYSELLDRRSAPPTVDLEVK